MKKSIKTKLNKFDLRRAMYGELRNNLYFNVGLAFDDNIFLPVDSDLYYQLLKDMRIKEYLAWEVFFPKLHRFLGDK